jgi:hypothetical protein
MTESDSPDRTSAGDSESQNDGLTSASRRTFLTLAGVSLVGTAAARHSGADTPALESALRSGDGYGQSGLGEGGFGGAPTVCRYIDGNGEINTPQLFDAIDDWRDDNIGTSVLLAVIDGWRLDGAVSGC